MKTKFFFLYILLFPVLIFSQQKIGYVVTENIMKELTEAVDAQKQLDNIASQWQEQLKKMQDDSKKKFEEYDQRKLFLSDRRRDEMEKELQDLDSKIIEFRTQKFGNKGELFTKQNDLMKPIQEKILKAIKSVADTDGYEYIFDKSSSTLLLYSNEKNDVTQKVISYLKAK
ncbi:MAG: OmpH family outer membrane protein [Ignavibacteria bacterium]|nr:OmpH family outer membrane protein [Bacteroidota bacterium]MSQ46437.1 OmpH family outer membrane protein [Ignavibacteria bacterium]